FTGANPYPVRMFQVCVSYDGKLIDTVPFGGIDQVIPYPQPSLLVWIISDRHGMFGRRCPECKSYFRAEFAGDPICPYCGYFGKNINFTTANQLKYIEAFCNAFIEAHRAEEDIILDLDKISTELPDNKSQWLYSEEQQQNRYKCLNCLVKYDVLGEYAL